MIFQDREGNRPNKAHSQTGYSRGRDLSGHRSLKTPTDRGTLTSWRWQREGLVGTGKETDQARRTHVLGTAEGGTCHDTERNKPRRAHSPTEDGRGRESSGSERNRPTEARSLSGDSRGRELSGHGKKQTDRGTLTHWRWQMDGLVRTRKEIDRARRAHFLGVVEGRNCQDTEKTNRPRHTHQLEAAEGGTCQDTKRNYPNEAHSRPGDGRGRNLSRHGKKKTEQGSLTL